MVQCVCVCVYPYMIHTMERKFGHLSVGTQKLVIINLIVYPEALT